MANKNPEKQKEKEKKKEKEHPYEYDLLVLGSGPAGVAAAMQAAKLDKKVVIVEKCPKNLGGAWLHTGTIPSKTIREVLSAIQNVKSHVGQHWADRLVRSTSTSHLLKRALSVSNDEEALLVKHLDSNNVKIERGLGRLEDRNSVRIVREDEDSSLITASKIMIATGSKPRRPPEIPFDGWRVVDSDDILQLDTVPKSLTIYGAGVIGCEYACIFGALGVDTTIVDSRALIMQSMDREITEELKNSMESLGIKFILGQRMKAIRTHGPKAILELPDHTLESDVCFFAAGRVSTTSGIGLERVEIKTNDRNAIVVNDSFQTAVPNIYAAGDAIGPPALASTSLEQGRIAANHAFGTGDRKFPKVFPLGIYTIPEMSSVGKSEAELQEEGINYVCGRADYEEVARGYIRGDNHGLLKILADVETEQLLGIHIVGADACNLIHIGQCCMLSGMLLRDLVDTVIFNYPTLAEAYRVAAFNAINQLPEKSKDDIPKKKPKKSKAA